MSDEEDASGFGAEIVEDTDDEDDTGFGNAVDEDDGDDETGAATGFGDADEDDDDGGDVVETSEPEPPSPTFEQGVWEAYAKENLRTGCSDSYEHPGLVRLWTKPVTNTIKTAKDASACIGFYKQLLTFMGDLSPQSSSAGSVSIGSFGGAALPSTFEMIEGLCWEGIRNKNFRTELYCQLAKQLYKNSSKMSHARGFILLNMYLGSFPPPSDMLAALNELIHLGPPTYLNYSKKRLAASQAVSNARKQPPVKSELAAVKAKKSLNVEISLPGGDKIQISLGPLSTCTEVIDLVRQKLRLKSTDGWGLRIHDGNVLVSLGKGKRFFYDAVARLERAAEDFRNTTAGSATIEFVKEQTVKSHSSLGDDNVALNLVTKQFFEAVKQGRLTFPEEKDYVHVFSTRNYLDYGNNLPTGEDFNTYIAGMLPSKTILDGAKKPKKLNFAKKVSEWSEIIEKSHARLEASREDIPKPVVQIHLFEWVQSKWPHFFASYYEVQFLKGEGFKNLKRAWIAVNENGLFIGEVNKSKFIKQFAFNEIVHAEKGPDGNLEIKTGPPTPLLLSFKLLRGTELATFTKLVSRLSKQ